MDLYYKIVYVPDRYTRDDICFLCSDNKIHIRLRDYDKPEVIRGFINKLTYITTLFVQNYFSLKRYEYGNTEDDIIRYFADKDENFWEIKKVLADHFEHSEVNREYKGIEILPNYRKIPEYSRLGSMDMGTGPFCKTVQELLSKFQLLDLVEFLLDDAYEIQIEEIKGTFNPYDKFNKKIKKEKKKAPKKPTPEYYSLMDY